jgi:hypothetical protein
MTVSKASAWYGSDRLRRWIAALCVTLTCGCASQVQERHYFATFSEPAPGTRVPTQFFRVSVDGSSTFANSRYLTGYFDERAVSLFFNELKGSSSGKLFLDDQKNPGTDTKLTPLNAPAGEGAFVLIMSTNADSIANTIGSFAESQVVADSLTRVLNKDRFREKTRSDALLVVRKADGGAVISRVEFNTKAASAAGTGDLAAAAYRRALTALAQALGYSGPEFQSTAAAQAWFSLESSRSGGFP